MFKKKVKLPKISKTDKRVGNFYFHVEDNYIKWGDVNGMMSHRCSLRSSRGLYLQWLLSENKEDMLKAYAVVMFNVFGCMPDAEFLEVVNKAATECVDRHPELYGIKPDISKEEDDAILKDTKEVEEAINEIKGE